MIVRRYVGGIVLRTACAVTAILLLIALSNKLVVFISRVAAGEISTRILFQLVGLHIPELLGFLLPLGIFIGIILGLGRLYVDNEMTALHAGGISMTQILGIVSSVTFGGMLLVAMLTFWIIPQFYIYKEQLLDQGESTTLLQTLAPGRFHALRGGTLVFYVESLSRQRQDLREVFIAEQPSVSADTWQVVTARNGYLQTDPTQGHRYLILSDGTRYEGTPGNRDYSRIEYETYGRLIDAEPPHEVRVLHRMVATPALWSSTSPSYRAELQWRCSIPLSVPILALLATSLSAVAPRAGRYAKLLPAILLYIIYYNLLTVSKHWMHTGKLSTDIGVWWVHGIFLLLAGGLWLQHTGSIHRFIYRLRHGA